MKSPIHSFGMNMEESIEVVTEVLQAAERFHLHLKSLSVPNEGDKSGYFIFVLKLYNFVRVELLQTNEAVELQVQRRC